MGQSRLYLCLIAVLSTGGLSGCETIHDQYIVDDAIIDRDAVSEDGSATPGPINLDTYIFHEDLISSVQIKSDGAVKSLKELAELDIQFIPNTDPIQSAYKRATGNREDRNRLQQDVIRRSNEICEAHQGRILANHAFINFSTGLTSTVLSGISAALGGETAKSALSTAAAAVGATGAEVNANFYQNLLATAIVRQINELRLSEYNKILVEQSKDLGDYTISQAMLDAAVYHSKCSFFVGVTALASETTETLTFAQIQARIKTLSDENEMLTEILDDENDERRSAAQMQLRLNETDIMRLRVMSRTASGAPASLLPEQSLAERIRDLDEEILGLDARIEEAGESVTPELQRLRDERTLKQANRIRLRRQLDAQQNTERQSEDDNN